MADYLQITLRSDLCAGSGESHGNVIDSDICLDAAGLPYLPARRLKGCLRQAAEQLARYGSPLATPEAIGALFGDDKGFEGALELRDAQLQGAEALRRWLAQEVPAPLRQAAHPANVTRLFTNVRGQTRLENGVAAEGSLRYTRVLDCHSQLFPGRAQALRAEAALHQDDPALRELLRQCCAATRHIGTHRNRGLGCVQITLESDPTRAAAPLCPATPPEAVTVQVEYRLALEAPVTLPGCDELLCEIPARSVIGCLAGQYLRTGKASDPAFRQLFLDGSARWSALTPVVNGLRTAPTPLMLAFLKNKGRYINRLAQTDDGWKTEKLKTLEGSYAAATPTGFALCRAATHTVYHHRHQSADKQAALYSQTALDAGQVYGGLVELPAALAPLAVSLLGSARLRFGRSRSAQYAACRLLGQPVLTPVRSQTQSAPGQLVYVVLQSDLALCRHGCYTVAPEAVRAALAEALGADPAPPPGTLDHCQYHRVSGYQATWQLQKAPVPVVRGGSVYCFAAPAGPLPTRLVLGEFLQEGFGQAVVLTAEQMRQRGQVCLCEVDPKPTAPDAKATAALHTALLTAAAVDAMRTTARQYCQSLPSGQAPDTGLLGRLRLMVTEAADYSDLVQRVEQIKTSDESSEKQNGKRRIALGMIRALCGENGIDPARLLAAQPALLPLLAADKEASRRVLAQWKRPLFAALHWLYYNKNRKGGEPA